VRDPVTQTPHCLTSSSRQSHVVNVLMLIWTLGEGALHALRGAAFGFGTCSGMLKNYNCIH
jgi:hypothetical protein